MSIFEINNFGRTVPYKHVTKCEIFSAPPSPVEINNLPATDTLSHPENLMVAPLPEKSIVISRYDRYTYARMEFTTLSQHDTHTVLYHLETNTT